VAHCHHSYTSCSGLKLVFRVERQDCSHSSVDPDSSLLGCYAMSSDPEDVGKNKGKDKFYPRKDHEDPEKE